LTQVTLDLAEYSLISVFLFTFRVLNLNFFRLVIKNKLTILHKTYLIMISWTLINIFG